MKKITFSLLLSVLSTLLWAAPLHNIPQTLVQPNGDTLHCFASGDEFFNYLHDANGYTIVQNSAGYFVYAIPDGDNIQPSTFVADKSNPVQLNIAPHVLPSSTQIEKTISRNRSLRTTTSALFDVSNAPPSYERNHGTLNNIVIFIRFSDEPSTIFSSLTQYKNIFSTGSTSMNTYFNEVSYGAIDITSTYYPLPDGTTVLSYQDSYPRNYYKKYSNTNPTGYNGSTQSMQREFELLRNAVNAVNSSVPTNLNLDMNNDGRVDNVTFIISGASEGWSDLLWPHRWSLYTGEQVSINSKRVYDFVFIPTADLSVSTLCHEMFHALGAPDLYHYNYYTNLTPVYRWDLMELNGTPAQHMSAYMKHKYGNWISDIPTITTSGTYTLSPLSTSATNNCYKIPIPGVSYQFYVLEYRKRPSSGQFEYSIPGDGLLIYRIDTRYTGNANYNGSSVMDEVYVFRPGGSKTANGSVNSANFSSNVNRTAFNANTNPYPFLSDGTRDNETNIHGISAAGATISFEYSDSESIILVNSINITTTNNVHLGETIPLSASVLPENASNKELTWTVINGTGQARITGNDLLGESTGSVTLKATAKDESGIFATKEIEVISILTNNTNKVYWSNAHGSDGLLTIEKPEAIGLVEVYSLTGAKVITQQGSVNVTSIQLSFANLAKGTYILKIWSGDKSKQSSVKIVW